MNSLIKALPVLMRLVRLCSFYAPLNWEHNNIASKMPCVCNNPQQPTTVLCVWHEISSDIRPLCRLGKVVACSSADEMYAISVANTAYAIYSFFAPVGAASVFRNTDWDELKTPRKFFHPARNAARSEAIAIFFWPCAFQQNGHFSV